MASCKLYNQTVLHANYKILVYLNENSFITIVHSTSTYLVMLGNNNNSDDFLISHTFIFIYIHFFPPAGITLHLFLSLSDYISIAGPHL